MDRYTSNSRLTSRARELRRNMTKEERKLWYEFLRNLPYKFHRQYVITSFIVDFCCVSEKLIIELDGSQHYQIETRKYDSERDGALNELGYTVLRYTNLDIARNFRGVCEDILRWLPPRSSGAPSREG